MTERHMNQAFYNQLFTMHATLMIFSVVMLIMVGCFGNFLTPLMIGARDIAFPKVYVLVLPAMGVTSEILSVFSRKPIFGYRAMAFSMIAIVSLS